MTIQTRLAMGLGRLAWRVMRLLRHQASTFPGRLTMRLAPTALAESSQGQNIICISGTNGKTTTTSMVVKLLEAQGFQVKTNAFGANLASGMMTTLLFSKGADYIVLEVDEAVFAIRAKELNPKAVVITNIFRDQLDRYGEVEQIFHKIAEACYACRGRLILCADDPLVASIGRKVPERSVYFGGNESLFHLALTNNKSNDSAHCPLCHHILSYKGLSLAHLGDYFCEHCSYTRAKADFTFNRSADQQMIQAEWHGADPVREYRFNLPLEGLYNAYNTAAALLLCLQLHPQVSADVLADGLSEVKPSFGRLERFEKDGRSICFVLVKNPAGMEQAVRLVCEAADVGGIAFFLNSHINDGTDVSWIWDAPLESYQLPPVAIGAGGERYADMALRLSYLTKLTRTADTQDQQNQQNQQEQQDQHAEGPLHQLLVEENKVKLVTDLLNLCPPASCLYLLPNYSAMMQLREDLADLFGYDKRWEANHNQ